jgi:hypothetical protein
LYLLLDLVEFDGSLFSLEVHYSLESSVLWTTLEGGIERPVQMEDVAVLVEAVSERAQVEQRYESYGVPDEQLQLN